MKTQDDKEQCASNSLHSSVDLKDPQQEAAALFLGSLLQNHLERACKVADQMGLTLEDLTECLEDTWNEELLSERSTDELNQSSTQEET
jgi:hypothetical protein